MASIDLAKLVVKLEAQTAQYDAKLAQATNTLKKFDRAAKDSTGRASAAIATYSTIAGIALLALTKRALDNAEQMKHMAEVYGLNTEALSTMAFAAAQSEVPVQALATSMKKLSVSQVDAANGGLKSKAAFEALGISATNLDGSFKPVDKLLLEIASSMRGFEDDAGKVAVANALMGRSGQEMIPFLNQGGVTIDALREKMVSLGLVVTDDMGKAADEFNDQLAFMGKLFEGLLLKAITPLLPALTELVGSMSEGAKEGGLLLETFRGVARFAGLATHALIGLSAGLGAWVRDFEAAGQAAYAIAQLDFSKAADIFEARGKAKDAESAELKRRTDAIWADPEEPRGPQSRRATPKKKLEFNYRDTAEENAAVDAAKKAASDMESALEQVREMSRGITEQVETYGMAQGAVIRYQLAHGKLSEQVKAAGAEGQKYVDVILTQTDALQRLQVAASVQQIDQEILTLTGHTAEAAAQAFDLGQKMAVAAATEVGGEVGANALKQIARLRELTVAQAKYNELEVDAEKIRSRLAVTEERISNSQQVGAINELEALAEIDSARRDSVVQLTAIVEKQKQIAELSGNVALIEGAEEAALALERLSRQTDLFAERFERILQDSGADAFSSFLDGTETAKDAFSSFLDSLRSQIADFVAEDLMRRLFGNMLTGGGAAGGGGGGWLQAGMALIGLAGGAATPAASAGGGFVGPPSPIRDRGGQGLAGVGYLIGTGAQPELFVPKQAGTFYPKGKYRDAGGAASRIRRGDSEAKRWSDTARARAGGRDWQEWSGGTQDRGGGSEAAPGYAQSTEGRLDGQPVGYRRGGLPMLPASLQAVTGGQAGAAGSAGLPGSAGTPGAVLPGGRQARNVAQMISRLSQVSSASNRTQNVSALSQIGASVSRSLTMSHSRDSGGRGVPGERYMVGVNAQPEAFIPDTVGKMGEGSGAQSTKITNNFTIQAPGGQVSRKTEAQIVAAAARGISQANRRGN